MTNIPIVNCGIISLVFAAGLSATILSGSLIPLSFISLLLIVYIFYFHHNAAKTSQRNRTNNKIITELLRKSEDHLNAILDGSYDGIISINASGVIESFNKGAESVFGYSKSEAIGNNINLIILDEEKEEHSQHIENASIKNHKVIRRARQLYGKHKSGKAIPVEISLNRYQENNEDKYVGVVRDISDLTKERNNLVEALQQAETANESKNRLLSSASHELRTPLNAIIGFSDILMQDDHSMKQEENQQCLQDISSSAQLLLLLVNDLLDYAKVQSQKVELACQPTALKPLLDSCLRFLTANIASQQLTLSIECPDHLCAMADEKRLKQVFINLLSNAIKYNYPQGKIFIKLQKTSYQSIVIEFIDTGIGIDPQKAHLLFQPFSRVHNSTQHIEGSGIGLALCKQLLQLMAGKISYQANPAGGSVFRMELPTAAACDVSPQALSRQDISSPHRLLNVLYVEDNPVNIRLMETMLSRIGLNNYSVTSAEAAYEYLKHHQPDIIFMDINLPGDSGPQATAKIKHDAKLAHIPVIAVSASLDKLNCADNVFDGAIPKPFTSKDLHSALRDASATTTAIRKLQHVLQA